LDSEIVIMTNVVLVTLACLVYALFAGAALMLFKASDRGAQWTKQATIWIGTATAIIIIRAILLSDPIDFGTALVSGAILVSAGVLFLASIGEQRRQLKSSGSRAELQYAGSTEAPAQLTVTGPYRYIRHPIYSSYALGWIGGTIASLDPIAIVLTIAMLALYIVSARTEEQAILRSSFADAYGRYQRSTTMFIPFVF
jgi:protein-S-isoprenylcysteine O-methyltransferase Ste14